jgi:hypothetical protein
MANPKPSPFDFVMNRGLVALFDFVVCRVALCVVDNFTVNYTVVHVLKEVTVYTLLAWRPVYCSFKGIVIAWLVFSILDSFVDHDNPPLLFQQVS